MSSSGHGYHDPHQQQGGYQQPGGYQQQGGGYYNDPGMYGGTRKKGGRGGKITFFIGLTVLVLSIIAVIAGIWMMTKTVLDQIPDGGGSMPNAFTGTTSVEAGNGEAIMILAINGSSPTCDVTGPGGPVDLDTSASSSSSQDGMSVETVGFFVAEQQGSYEMSCSGADEFSHMKINASDLLTGGGLMLGGMFFGFVAFIVTIIGLVVWVVGRKKTRY